MAQSEHVQRTLLVNGQSGNVNVYRIDGKSYVELETLVRIANGSIAFEGNTVILTFPGPKENIARETPAHNQQDESVLSNEFMKTSIESLGAVKEWINTLTYAAKRGVPGDGSRIVVLQDRATETLLQAKAHASSNADHNALQLLTNNYNTLKAWSDQLIGERRIMDTGKYSLSPELIDRDETYQKIVACTKFLAAMVPNGQFQDDRSCH
ncbi:MAG: hypothetical protein ROO76_12980 [Terriglobia bacterium]|nr:hypothetical protein [Terriglobia bacterium]